MGWRTGRTAQWIPLVLVFIGSLAFASGLFVAVLTMTRTYDDDRGISQPRHGVIYVGADTCFTCHKDQTHDWSLLVDSQPVASPVTNPQAALVDVAANESIPHLDLGSTVPILEAAAQPSDPHYVITTENDQILHADQWSGDSLKSKPLGWTAQCADCHTKPTRAGGEGWHTPRTQFG
jgi:hypothetical protein